MRRLKVRGAGVTVEQWEELGLWIGIVSVSTFICRMGPKIMQACAELGVGWVRIDFNWSLIEPSQRGGQNWGIVDDVVAQAAGAGLAIFATIAYSPRWAATGSGAASPPSDGQFFYDFVKASVERYGDRIRHWGIWNEPNLSEYFSGSMADYVDRILIPGAKAVRDANPDCLVLGPELSDVGKFSNANHWSKWMSYVFDREREHGSRLIDIVTHHMYKKAEASNWYDFWSPTMWRMMDGRTVNTGLWGEGPTLKAHLAACGVSDRPFWLTETGWNCSEIGEDGQARSYRKYLEGIESRIWVEKTFFYEIQDDPNRADGVREGITDEHSRRKPAFGVLQSVLQ